jgi:N-acetylmuramoyl-L-alanine amidase
VWAAEYQGPVAYVSCHLNAGGGSYGLTIHDHRSSMGRRMAEHVAGALGELLLEGVDRVVIGATKPGETWPRAWGCIKDIYPGPTNIAACLFEPLFLDNHEHQQWLNDAGLEAIGFKLGEALIRWGHGDQTC